MPMPEQVLDHPDIHTLFQQVSGKAMPQSVHGDVLAESGHFGGLPADALQLPRRDMPLRIGAREQPVGRAIDLQ